MKKISYITLLILPLLSVSLNAQTLSDLAWLTGYWTAAENGATAEELWSAPAGGMMLGFHRDVAAGGEASFEFLRIVENDGTIVYLASPNGQAPTAFTLTEISPYYAVFENPEHDFPQRIIYSLQGDEITARVEDESGGKGMQWTWTKTEFDD